MVNCSQLALIKVLIAHIIIIKRTMSSGLIAYFTGYLLTFLTKLPLLGAAFSTKLAYMNTLQQVTVVNCLEEVSWIL